MMKNKQFKKSLMWEKTRNLRDFLDSLWVGIREVDYSDPGDCFDWAWVDLDIKYLEIVEELTFLGKLFPSEKRLIYQYIKIFKLALTKENQEEAHEILEECLNAEDFFDSIQHMLNQIGIINRACCNDWTTETEKKCDCQPPYPWIR